MGCNQSKRDVLPGDDAFLGANPSSENESKSRPGGEDFDMDERFSAPKATDEGGTYDYAMSTQENHTVDAPEWWGHHEDIRTGLDHKYHGYYSRRRQVQ